MGVAVGADGAGELFPTPAVVSAVVAGIAAAASTPVAVVSDCIVVIDVVLGDFAPLIACTVRFCAMRTPSEGSKGMEMQNWETQGSGRSELTCVTWLGGSAR